MRNIQMPEPRGDGLDGEFYQHTANDELRFQKCDDCGAWRHMPRHTCADCGSNRWTWALSSGKGRLYTWTVTHRSFHPAFDDLPYAIAVVELEEGIRLVTWLTGIDIEDYRLDLPVSVNFIARGEFKLPVFSVNS